jgi:hypothetical protein
MAVALLPIAVWYVGATLLLLALVVGTAVARGWGLRGRDPGHARRARKASGAPGASHRESADSRARRDPELHALVARVAALECDGRRRTSGAGIASGE